MSDSAVLTLAGSSFHTTAVAKQRRVVPLMIDFFLLLAMVVPDETGVAYSKAQQSGGSARYQSVAGFSLFIAV
jgi:hypothetical protein